MLGALLAPCGAGQPQMSKVGSPLGSPAQKVDGARRPELSVSRLRGLGRAPRGACADGTKPVVSVKSLALLGHKMMQKGCR